MTTVLSEAQANHCPAELIERRDVSANLAILRFRVAERPSFTAGQYATIGIAIDDDVVERILHFFAADEITQIVPGI